jgi:hypothetical protein
MMGNRIAVNLKARGKHVTAYKLTTFYQTPVSIGRPALGRSAQSQALPAIGDLARLHTS